MNLVIFAKRHKLTVTKDGCDDPVVLGKVGYLYDYDDGRLGACFHFTSGRAWNGVRTRMVNAGCRVIQNGDTEGSILFQPTDSKQVTVALSSTRITPNISKDLAAKKPLYFALYCSRIRRKRGTKGFGPAA